MFLTVLFLGLLTVYAKAQEIDLKKNIVNNVLAPYRGSFYAYLIADKNNETRTREDFLKLFSSDTIIVYNDIPDGSNYGTYLTISQYTQLSKTRAINNFRLEIEFDNYELLLCSKFDSTIYVKKTFLINDKKTIELLKIKIRYFPDALEDPLKIVSIEKANIPSDKDGDKVPDYCDDCPSIFGNINYFGCTKKDRDTDGDGTPDKDDDCIDLPGLAKFNGCPDTDGDGIPDKSDECPNQQGSTNTRGCPDKDNDGVPDDEDDCIDLRGIAKFSGCPDKDGDGIPDKYDRCPNEHGKSEIAGCPDSDSDGVADVDDKCPFEGGTPTNFGCPKKKKSKMYQPIVLSALGVASLGSSFYFREKSNQYYADYEKNLTAINTNELYDKANKAHHTKLILVYTGAATTYIGVTWLIAKIYVRKQNPLYSRFNITPGAEGISLSYSF